MSNLSKETKLTLLYILVAFTFSVLMRLIWVYQFDGYAPFIFNGQFMINTNDGYYWAEGARDLLLGTGTNPDAKEYFDHFHQLHDLSPVDTAAAQVTAFFAYVLPFSFESIIFYLPAFLSSLVVVPVILIAKSLKNLEMGLIAALLASIAWSYYNRTMVGYYDTDMLNIVLPMFLLWSIIWAIRTKQDIYLLLTALDILVYRWWYPESYALETSFFGLILLYILIFDRENRYNYKLLSMMLFAMMGLPEYIRLIIVLIAYIAFKKESMQKYIYHILAFAMVLYFGTGGFTPIWGKLKGYVFKDAISVGEEGLKLHFFTVKQTIREVGQIPFETLANRISGHPAIFVISLIGYAYLSFRHKIMILALPLVGLGLLASVGGLRFTIYAVPVLALGIAFLITELSSLLPNAKLKIISMMAFTIAILFPNYTHIEGYRVPTVFSATEVKTLDKLKHIADREDYVIGWWDYGYPIRYYADVKTLADGGKHSGSVNFPLSYILTKPQDVAAKMARLDVEQTEKSYALRDANKDLIQLSTIEQMTTEHGFKDTNDFLLALETDDIKLPKKTRDIYFYLPYKMMNILPTINLFSNIDIMNGKQGKRPFFFVSRHFKDMGDKINFGSNIYLDKKRWQVVVREQRVPLKRFTKTVYDKKRKLHVDEKLFNVTANLNVIFMSNYNTYLIIDDAMYNSLYIQLMVLEKADPKLFEAVNLTPRVKIYKLKI